MGNTIVNLVCGCANWICTDVISQAFCCDMCELYCESYTEPFRTFCFRHCPKKMYDEYHDNKHHRHRSRDGRYQHIV